MTAERELSPPPVLWADGTAEGGIGFVRVNGAVREKQRTRSGVTSSATPTLTDATTGSNTGSMGKIRRGNHVFVTWVGDHSPQHVHVYRDGQLVVKWDLENDKPMKGRATRRVLELIAELRAEGLL
ncbi:MAG: DUF4160 domain-containing protein [bacterium]|nr:DUF4160 domain-containing protein [bacterium]